MDVVSALHNEDVADSEAEIASDMSVTRSAAPCVWAAEINCTGDGQQREFDSTNCCNIIMSPMLLDMSSFLFEKKDRTHFFNVCFPNERHFLLCNVCVAYVLQILEFVQHIYSNAGYK